MRTARPPGDTRGSIARAAKEQTAADSGTLVLPFVFVAHAVVDSHLHVWDGTAAGLDAGPMKVGYSAQATASVELFMDYMDEAGVDRAVFVQPWFYHWDNRYMVVAASAASPTASAACA